MKIQSLIASLPPVAALFLAVGPAQADDSTPPVLQQITVTAQRRSQNLQAVPIAITAVTAAQVQREGIHNLTTLAASVPGLTMSPFSVGQNIISLRGASSNDDGAGTDDDVAVFVDGVYAGRVSNINPELFDVERIEVLRGPQGTLYGKNTIGGAINIISSLPRTDGLHVRADTSIGNFGRHDFDGLITGPLGGAWAGKLVVSTRKADGWAHNLVLHTNEHDDDTKSVRGQLLREDDKTQLLLTASASGVNDSDMARTPMSNQTSNLPFSPQLVYQSYCGTQPNPTCAANPYDGYQRQWSYGTSAKFTDHLSSHTDFVSITAWQRTYNQWSMDSLGAGLGLGNDVSDDTKEWTEEMRLVSSAIRNVKSVVGIWLSREDTDRLRLFLLPSIEPDPALDESYRGIDRTLSEAIFGQFDWQFADRWTLTVGGRYSYDHKTMGNDAFGDSCGAVGLGIVPNCLVNQVAAGWGRFTPKVTLSYRPTSAVNLYATASEGFKSGGFAATPTDVAETKPLRPETADNLEFGAKMQFAERLRANLALFDVHYKDLQIQTFGPNPNTAPHPPGYVGEFETFNAGGARADGAELELTWLATDALSFTASYGYMDARFTSVYLPNASVYSLIGGPGNTACVANPNQAGCEDLRNQSGKQMLRAPRNKGDVQALYQFSLEGAGHMEASASVSYTAEQRGELEPYAIQPAFALIDARLSWYSPSDEWEVSLWGRNLANRVWVSHVYTIADEVFGVYGTPRTYGLELSWSLNP